MAVAGAKSAVYSGGVRTMLAGYINKAIFARLPCLCIIIVCIIIVFIIIIIIIIIIRRRIK